MGPSILNVSLQLSVNVGASAGVTQTEVTQEEENAAQEFFFTSILFSPPFVASAVLDDLSS